MNSFIFNIDQFCESVFNEFRGTEFEESLETIKGVFKSTLTTGFTDAAYPNKNGARRPASMKAWMKAGDFKRKGYKWGDTLQDTTTASNRLYTTGICWHGNKGSFTLPTGEVLNGTWELHEASALTPSHDALNGFQKTDGFPVDGNGQTMNDRDYERDIEAQRITREIAANYDSRAIQSPVIICSLNGIVLSGNGRTMAGVLAAEQDTDSLYIDYLYNHCREYGFTEDVLDRFDHPRLVLGVPFGLHRGDRFTAATFAQFNAQEMKAQSKTEKAVKLGKLVDDQTFGRILHTVNKFDTLCEFYADQQATADVLTELANAHVIGRMESPNFMDGESLSAEGRELLENTLIGKAFAQKADNVRMLTENKCMRKVVVTALSEIANNLTLTDYSLESEFSQAIDLCYAALNNGYRWGDRVSGFARQQTLFGDEDNTNTTVADYKNATVMMLADMLNNKQVTRLKKAFTCYNHQAHDAACGQVDMFTGSVKTKQDILADVLTLLNEGDRTQQAQALREATQQRTQQARETASPAIPTATPAATAAMTEEVAAVPEASPEGTTEGATEGTPAASIPAAADAPEAAAPYPTPQPARKPRQRKAKAAQQPASSPVSGCTTAATDEEAPAVADDQPNDILATLRSIFVELLVTTVCTLIFWFSLSHASLFGAAIAIGMLAAASRMGLTPIMTAAALEG